MDLTAQAGAGVLGNLAQETMHSSRVQMLEQVAVWAFEDMWFGIRDTVDRVLWNGTADPIRATLELQQWT